MKFYALRNIRSAKNTAAPAKIHLTRFHMLQSLLASVYIFIVFFLMNSLQNDLAVASLGASAFIAFSFPKTKSSRPRYLIGGYIVGAASGLLSGLIAAFLQAFLPFPTYIPACAFSVLTAMLLMTVFNFEHPPSAAFAVAVTLDPNPLTLSLSGLGCILLLSLFKELFKKYMRDL